MAEVKKYKKHLVIALLMLMPLTITGCWGRRETQQMNLSTAMGFDRLVVDGKSQFRWTTLSAKPPQAGGGGTGGSGGISEPQRGHTNQVISIDGDNIWDAGRNWDLRSSRRLFVGQVVVVVIGEETARQGMDEIMDFLLRHQDVRERTWIVICQGLAADFLNSQPEYEPILSAEIDGILKNAWIRSAKVKGTDLFNVSYALLTPGKEAAIPYMTLFKPPEPSSPINQNRAGSSQGTNSGILDSSGPQPQNQTLHTTGFSVFQGYRLVGLMSAEESQGLLFLTNQVKTCTIPISVDASEKNVAIRLDNSKTQIKPIIGDGHIQFKVNIKATGNMMEESEGSVRISPEDWKMVEDLVGQEIERRCLEAVKTSQELSSDVMGFGDKLHRTNPKAWKVIENDWEQIFPTVTVTVKTEFKLKQTGVISDPIVVR